MTRIGEPGYHDRVAADRAAAECARVDRADIDRIESALESAAGSSRGEPEDVVRMLGLVGLALLAIARRLPLVLVLWFAACVDATPAGPDAGASVCDGEAIRGALRARECDRLCAPGPSTATCAGATTRACLGECGAFVAGEAYCP